MANISSIFRDHGPIALSGLCGASSAWCWPTATASRNALKGGHNQTVELSTSTRGCAELDMGLSSGRCSLPSCVRYVLAQGCRLWLYREWGGWTGRSSRNEGRKHMGQGQGLGQGSQGEGVIWVMTRVEQALGKGKDAQGGRLEVGVCVWDLEGENVWWAGGGLRG